MAFTGPSKKFVSETMQEATAEIQKSIEAQQAN